MRRFPLPTAVAAVALIALATPAAASREEKLLAGSYRLAQRAASDGRVVKPPEALGFLTFTGTHRTVIMKWTDAAGAPVSVALIARYTISGGKYCETVDYGVQSNLGQPGVAYDPPQDTPRCTSVADDASGLAFDVPGESLRLRITRDGIIATTPRWTDTWVKAK